MSDIISVRKIITLKTKPQFTEVLSKGVKSVCRNFVLFYYKDCENKFGFIASRKHFKKAVERNRAKRRLKAALFNVLKNDCLINIGHYVVILRRSILTHEFKEIENELSNNL